MRKAFPFVELRRRASRRHAEGVDPGHLFRVRIVDETQALIYDPHTKKVTGINALGVAPTGATPEFYKGKGFAHPPDEGVLAAVTPGTPGGIMTMVAEYGRLSLKEVLAPAIEMADGYALEAQSANTIDRNRDKLKAWPYSKKVFLIHENDPKHPGPVAGEIFRQPDLAAPLPNHAAPHNLHSIQAK